jgi:hypothetical protein
MRDFMPENEEDRVSIQPHNIANVIDSLDNFRSKLISLRRVVEDDASLLGESKDLADMSYSLNKSINAVNRKMDDLDEARNALRRYTDR